MNPEFIVGQIFHPQKKTYVAAVGHHFNDSPGFYQFFVIGSSDNFRKRPTLDDTVRDIDWNIFDQLKKVK